MILGLQISISIMPMVSPCSTSPIFSHFGPSSRIFIFSKPSQITLCGNLTPSGSYTPSSTYLAQFETSNTSFMKSVVWNNWATRKCKFFVKLTIQNWVWMVDRLLRRGWLKCGLCQLFFYVPVSVNFSRGNWSWRRTIYLNIGTNCIY